MAAVLVEPPERAGRRSATEAGFRAAKARAVRAVITAGGLVDDRFADAIGTRVKALAPFGVRTLLDVALDACAGAGIADITVIGGPEVRAHLAARETRAGAADTGTTRVIDADADGGVNVLRALGAWPGERFLYLTSDMPFATAAGVRELIARSASFAVTMALADVDAYEARFPGAAEHSVTLGGERVANGNAFVIAPEAVAPARVFATKLFAARKSLPRLALLLGPSLCLRFALKRLSIADLEAFGRRRLGVPVGAVRGCDPGLCYDVDTFADYEYALAHAEAPR